LRVGCFTCHGTVGHGGAAPRLTPNTLPLPGFTTWVRNGTPGWTIATGMPAFSTEVLSGAELADVRAYLAGLPPPRAVADIPLLAP
jgi:mono/diheme cytochrome c family protein